MVPWYTGVAPLPHWNPSNSDLVRPFQIDLLFLVNKGSKNLPASQEKQELSSSDSTAIGNQEALRETDRRFFSRRIYFLKLAIFSLCRCFFFFKIPRKPTSQFTRNNKSISNGLMTTGLRMIDCYLEVLWGKNFNWF